MQREKKWTKGPWEAFKTRGIIGVTPSYEGSADVAACSGFFEGIRKTDEEWANARLIAEAPKLVEALEKSAESLSDMLEAFKSMMREDEFTFHKGRVERAHAALAKAYGEDA